MFIEKKKKCKDHEISTVWVKYRILQGLTTFPNPREGHKLDCTMLLALSLV